MILQKISEKFLKNTLYWTVILLALIPGIYSSLTIMPYITLKITLFRMAISFLFVVYIALVLKNKDYLPKKSHLLISFFLFIVTCLLSGFFSLDPTWSFWSSTERFFGSYSMIHFFILTLILGSVFKTKEIWNKILKWWNFVIFGTSAISFIIFFANNIIYKTSLFSERFQGFSGNPIYFSAILLVFFFINIYLFFEDIQFRATIKKVYHYLIMALGYAFFIILTGSRGAFVSLGVTLLVLLISLIFNKNLELEKLFKINFQKLALFLCIIIFLSIGSLFVFKNTNFIKNNYILVRLSNINPGDNASFSRIVVSKIALECFKEKPILGWGFDNFEICFQQHFDKDISKLLPEETRFDKTHNMPFEILATNGIFGFIFFMGIYFFAYKKIRDLMLSDKLYFYSGLSIILAIVVYFIQNLFVFDVFEGMLAICLVFGFIIGINGDEDRFNFNIRKSYKNWIFLMVLVISLLNIYSFNYKQYHANTLPITVRKLVSDGKIDEALLITKNLSKTQTPNIGELYIGTFGAFIYNPNSANKEQISKYYEIAFQGLRPIIENRPYLTKLYIVLLMHLSTKSTHALVNQEPIDIIRAREIYEQSKKYNLNQPEIEIHFAQVLLNSGDHKLIKEGSEIVVKALDIYPERGILNLMYGHYLISEKIDIEEGVLNLKKGLTKRGGIETTAQLINTIEVLIENHSADFAIEILNKYIEQNPGRYHLYALLTRAHIIQKNYFEARDSLFKAEQVYRQNKGEDKNEKIEKEILMLVDQINAIKPK